jgi:hypothetical protein
VVPETSDCTGQKVSGQSRGRKRERDGRKDIDSSDDESFDQEYSRWSEYDRTRAKSKSPQPPKIEEEILDSLYLIIGNSDSLGLGYWLESGHLTDPGQIAEY